MFSGEVRSTNFPQGSIEITDINDVPLRVSDLDAISHPVWLPDEQIYPADEACDRRLQGKAKDQRKHSQ